MSIYVKLKINFSTFNLLQMTNYHLTQYVKILNLDVCLILVTLSGHLLSLNCVTIY